MRREGEPLVSPSLKKHNLEAILSEILISNNFLPGSAGWIYPDTQTQQSIMASLALGKSFNEKRRW